MYLSNIKLWNFRKFGDEISFDLSKPHLDLNFQKGINVLIGENDTGKSAIIDAIKLVLKTHSFEWIRVTDDDFYKNTDRLRIELIFTDFSDEEAKHFTEWLGWKGEGTNAKSFLKLIYDVSRDIKRKAIKPSEVRAGVDEVGVPLSAEAKDYLKVTYLKPLRDAQSELVPRRNSRLSQILLGHDVFKKVENDHILVRELENFNKKVEEYFEGTEEEHKGRELKDEIDNFIHSFYDRDKESKFTIAPPDLKKILEKLEVVIKDDINPGLGTLNRLFMAIELVHLHKKDWTGLRLGLIEELEAHIHPQAQMKIIETLQDEKGIQLILTTHSPNLGSKVKLENLILFTQKGAFPLGKNYTELKEDDYIFL